MMAMALNPFRGPDDNNNTAWLYFLILGLCCGHYLWPMAVPAKPAPMPTLLFDNALKNAGQPAAKEMGEAIKELSATVRQFRPRRITFEYTDDQAEGAPAATNPNSNSSSKK